MAFTSLVKIGVSMNITWREYANDLCTSMTYLRRRGWHWLGPSMALAPRGIRQPVFRGCASRGETPSVPLHVYVQRRLAHRSVAEPVHYL